MGSLLSVCLQCYGRKASAPLRWGLEGLTGSVQWPWGASCKHCPSACSPFISEDQPLCPPDFLHRYSMYKAFCPLISFLAGFWACSSVPLTLKPRALGEVVSCPLGTQQQEPGVQRASAERGAPVEMVSGSISFRGRPSNPPAPSKGCVCPVLPRSPCDPGPRPPCTQSPRLSCLRFPIQKCTWSLAVVFLYRLGPD